MAVLPSTHFFLRGGHLFMKRIIAMYLRVSTLDQARNGYGLGDQEVQCKKYIDLY